MTGFTLRTRVIAIAAAVAPMALLAACGSTIGADQREKLVSSCVSSAGQSGLAAAQLTEICGCTADKMIAEKITLAEAASGGEKVQRMTQECVMATLRPGGAAAAPATTPATAVPPAK